MKKKSKTFTGCWTCRARQIKCDETRPRCQKCRRSRLDCEGYGVRLRWTQNNQSFGLPDDQSSPRNFSGRRIDLTSQEGGNLSSGEINNLLRRCDDLSGTDQTQLFGPFSVFRARLPTSPLLPFGCTSDDRRWRSLNLSISEPADSSILSSTTPPSGSSPASTSARDTPFADKSPNFVDRTVSIEGREVVAESTFASLGLSYQDRQQGATLPLSTNQQEAQPTDLPHRSQRTLQYRTPVLRSPVPTSDLFSHTPADPAEGSVPPSERDEVSSPSCQRDLIHHWVFFLCKNMVPIDSIDNPYRVVYLPLASQALLSHEARSSSGLAIYHGICAVSAESILYLKFDRKDVSEVVAMWHGRLALQYLQESLQESLTDDVSSVLGAILIFVMRDSVTGTSHIWRSHVKGALNYLSRTGNIDVQPGSDLHTVLLQFLCLAVFGNVKSAFDLGSLIAQLPDSTDYLCRHHNISKFLLRSILSINHMSSVLDDSDQHIQQLELQAYLSAPTNVSEQRSHDAKQYSTNFHYSHVYYYSLLIFIQRKIHHRPPDEIQDMVEAGLSHLEISEIEAEGTNGCILLWPCLVIAIECNDPGMQSRALKWFQSKGRHGFKSVDTAMQICTDYWVWRDNNPLRALSITWQDFVEGTDYDVVPL